MILGKRSLIFHSTPTSKPVRSETVEMGMSGLSVSPIATERYKARNERLFVCLTIESL